MIIGGIGSFEKTGYLYQVGGRGIEKGGGTNRMYREGSPRP